MPTADKTTSASIISSPLSFLIVAFTPSPVVSTDINSLEVIILIPLFLKDFSNCFDISLSSIGTILGMYSTIVTSVPIEL